MSDETWIPHGQDLGPCGVLPTTLALPNTGDVSLPIMLAIEAANEPEAWLMIRGHIDTLKALVKKLDDACDDKGLEVVRACGPFQCDTKRWYERDREKGTWLIKKAKALNFLRDKLMGDEDALERCIKSDALNHGAVKKELAAAGCPEAFAELYKTEIVKELATGAPVKELACIDTKYLT